MRVYIGFNHSEAWPIALASAPVRQWTKARLKDIPTHTWIGFQRGSEEIVYFDAVMGAGWRGPRPLSKIEAWAAEKPDERWIHYYQLLCTSDEAGRMYADACSHCFNGGGVEWFYNVVQLWQMLRNRITGKPVPSSEGDIVCSEGDVRVIEAGPCSEFTIRRRLMYPRKGVDELTPHDLECIVKEL
jgi:hypothetical protein